MPRRKRPERDTGAPTIAVGYVRVSTAEQHESGAGLEDQRRAIETECLRRGWELARVFDDKNGASGKDLRRPGLLEALSSLSAGDAQVLVTSKLDRLSRSVLDFASLMQQAERESWAIVVLDVAVDTSSPSGEMMANVVAAFAQYERRLISDRTKKAMAVKKSQGVTFGRRRQVPEETRERVRALRADGWTFQEIADVLNEEGVPRGQDGRQWYPSTVRGLLS